MERIYHNYKKWEDYKSGFYNNATGLKKSNFGGIYGGTSGMGWKNISKPSHFTWKQYAEFLISTLPEKTKKN